jgi:hypothetical protein
MEVKVSHREGLNYIGEGPYPALVLVEGEGDMWLASVRFDEPPQPGMTFHFRGMVWELVWASEAGCGAAPAAM